MRTFRDANRARTSLKMMLSQYSWYNGSSVNNIDAEYTIIVNVTSINNYIRKIIPNVYQNTPVKTELYVRK